MGKTAIRNSETVEDSTIEFILAVKALNQENKRTTLAFMMGMEFQRVIDENKKGDST